MNVRKFIAASARDALKKVKETLGNDAIILSNRGVPGGVEIMAVAARDMAMIAPTPADDVPLRPASRAVAEAEDDYRVTLTAARARVSTPAAPAARRPEVRQEPPRQEARPAVFPRVATTAVNASIPRQGALRHAEIGRNLPSTAATSAGPASARAAAAAPAAAPQSVAQARKAEAEVVPREVMDEIRSLRKIVEQHLAGFAWGETARSEPVKTELLRQMLDSGFSPRLARELLQDLPTEMDVRQATAWVRGAADRALNTLGNLDDIIDQGGVYALVGPTGVGKTTTTAKLAARCVLRFGPSKVALITTDGYRIGAHEQLRIYGRILGVSVHLVKDAAELQQTLIELEHKHLVLIDTMGMSQKDRLVSEMNDMLSGCAVNRLLLLSATSRGDTLDDVVSAYRGSGLAGCILTKIDEAASLAAPLDVIMRHSLALHYVSNGQRVPEDLHLPNRSYLLHRAFKDAPDASAHKYDGIEPGLMMANAGGMAVAGGRRG